MRAAHFPAALPTRHVVLVPVSTITHAVEETLGYAKALSAEARAVYVAEDSAYAQVLAQRWKLWGTPLPLDVIEGRYGEVVEALQGYIEEAARAHASDRVTVLLPELATRRWPLLQHRTVRQLKHVLADTPHVVVVTVSPTRAGRSTPGGKAHLRVL